MKRVRLLWSAEQEMLDAARYYETQAPGLGGDFLDKVDAALEDIGRNPERWPAVRLEIRRRLIHRFPYAVLYRVDPAEVVALAVMHLHRRPTYWQYRT